MKTTKAQERDTVRSGSVPINPFIWRSIVETIDDPIFLHDAQFRVLLANRAYLLAGDMTEADALNKPYWEVFPRGSGPLPECRATPKGGPCRSNKGIRVGEKLFASTGYAVRDDQGKFLYSMHILNDITAQTQAEGVLQDMTTKFQTVFDSAPDAIILFEDGRISDCNEAALRLFGFPLHKDFMGSHPADLSPPAQPGGEDSLTLANAHISAAITNGSVLFEWVHRRRDGTEFPAEVHMTAMQLNGKSLLQGRIFDLTERKKAQASEMRYRRLFEAAKDGILILDAETGMILDANPFITELMGYSHEECLGKHIWDIGPFENIAANLDKFQELRQQEYVRYEDLPLETFQGQTIHVEFVSNVYLVDTVKVIQCNIRDITRRKLAEDKNIRLAQMSRTISRCNEVLVRAQDEFSLAHDMCQILTEAGNFRFAWVGNAAPDTDNPIRVLAASGSEKEASERLESLWADKKNLGEGPAGAAIRTGQIVMSHDIRTDVRYEAEKKQALQLGYLSVAAIPLKIDPQVIGVLVVYGEHANAFSEDIIGLLSELTGDLTFGIANLRAKAERMDMQEKLEHSLDKAVIAIAATVEMRDPYTAGHQRRVAKLATVIASEMGLSGSQIQGLRMACVLHDIGKIHVPAEILSSPSRLSVAEFEIIKLHPQTGWEILKGIDFPWPVAEIIYQHHEKQDGTGYPRGLKGDEILLEARILSVADVVEAMTSHRPYRPGFGLLPALQEIARHKGDHYDAAVVDACLRVFMEKNYEWQ